MRNNVLIVGHGVTGKNLDRELTKLEPDIADIKYVTEYGNPFYRRNHDKYDFIFICVDTPYTDEIKCDISAIFDVLEYYEKYRNDGGVYVIKSTILPGFTKRLIEKYKLPIIYSPEYYGDTQHCNNFEFNFTILGGNKSDCIKVQNLLQYCHDARHTFRIVDSEVAEVAKYMENAWLATKVSFCSQFYKISNEVGINYEDVRELFILDPRVNPSHTFIYRDKPYWDSHCLNKDVRAIAETTDSELLKSVIDFNEKLKSEV